MIMAVYAIATFETVTSLSHHVALQKAKTIVQPVIAVMAGKGCAHESRLNGL